MDMNAVKKAINEIGDSVTENIPYAQYKYDPPVLFNKSNLTKFKSRQTISIITPNPPPPSNAFTTQGGITEFDLSNITCDTIEHVIIEFNVTNNGAAITYPLPTPWWIQYLESLIGSTLIERIYNTSIAVEQLAYNDNTQFAELASVQLQDPNTGFHLTSGIAVGATATYALRLPSHAITNSFLITRALKGSIRYRLQLNSGNNMFTTAAQTLSLNSMRMVITGAKFEDTVIQDFLELHQRQGMVCKCEIHDYQIYPLNIVAASTAYQQVLNSIQGKVSSLMFLIRPSTIGTTNYGLDQIENCLQIAQITQLTDSNGTNSLNGTIYEYWARVMTLLLHEFKGSFRTTNCYCIPWTFEPRLSSTNGKDTGTLEFNGSNYLNFISAAASTVNMNLVVMVRYKAIIGVDKDGQVYLTKM